MKAIPTTVLAVLVLGACASNPAQRDAEKLVLYRAHAGPPVPSIQYFGRVSGWTPLGDSALALWKGPGRAWLLELDGPCTDLEFSPTIALTNQTGRVYPRFDKVLVDSRGLPNIPCRIAAIRPLDIDAIRNAERAARAQASGGK